MVMTYEHEGKTYIKGELLPQDYQERNDWLLTNSGAPVIYAGGATCSGGNTPEREGMEPGVYESAGMRVGGWCLTCCDEDDGKNWGKCHADHFFHAVEYSPTTEDLEAVWE